MRTLLGIVLGIAAAILIILAVQAFSDWAYPISLEIDADDPQVFARVAAAMPLPAKWLMLLGWFLAAFGGAWLALRISDWRWSAWFAIGATLGDGIANLFQFPHPLWMQAATIVAPLAGAWLAFRLHRTPHPGEPLLG